MKLKLTLKRPGSSDDVLLTADPGDPVGVIAAAIAAADPQAQAVMVDGAMSLAIVHPEHVEIPADVPLASSGIQSGQIVSLTRAGGRFSGAGGAQGTAATMVVVSGPDAGATFSLPSGTVQIGRGRGNDIALTDPLVSKAHVRINVGEQIDIIDLGSANGVQLRGTSVARAVLGPDDLITIGDTSFRVTQHAAAAAVVGAVVEFNRSPRLDPVFPGEEFIAPTPPSPPQAGRFPIVPMFAPVLMAGLMFLITKNASSVVFMALSPLMMVGSFMEQRISGKKAFELGKQQFLDGLKDLEIELHHARELEVAGRAAEHPPVGDVVTSVRGRTTLVWTRRPDRRGFMELRLGLGAQRSRHSVKLPSSNNTTPDLWRTMVAIPKRYEFVPDVPVVCDFSEYGSLGLVGAWTRVADAARSAVVHLSAMHSPAELIVCAVVSPDRAPDWDWLKWLPHTTSDHSPIASNHLAVSDSAQLVAALREVVDQRLSVATGTSGRPSLPRVVVVVDDGASMDRADLVSVLEDGASCGVHGIWISSGLERLPAVCRMFLRHDGTEDRWSVGDIRDGSEAVPVIADLVDGPTADLVSRRLSPMVDATAVVEDDSDIPRMTALLDHIEPEVASDPELVIARWRASSSLPSEYPKKGERFRRDEITLRAVIGSTVGQPFILDLRTHGPHALVGGTTGAGKSEFLQTWVASMATAHSPDRVNFLFVDYKGGAAFAECVDLPHSVGLVTDLSPHLVRRALVSLKAELKYREELLQHHSANDLVALEKKDPAAAPPSLVIVVDEFAALVKEVPEFVDGVVDVAQRGRSLGLHLVLATQRPAGVIRDNLRANTNLRIALRMADEADSLDVVGSKQAALFDRIPGRAMAKIGAGKLTTFQTGYVGGWTTGEAPPSMVQIQELRLGGGEVWQAPEADGPASEPADRGPNDLTRIVSTVAKAAEVAAIPPPRKPWQPELSDSYELARVRPSRSDRSLVFGFIDDPANQRQVEVQFEPDRDGNMAVFGTGGSGKSAFLRTIAVAAGLGTDGPCHVYGLDFGSRGLTMLEALPHVGTIVSGDDDERVRRLLRSLRKQIDDRAKRFAQVQAGSITEYRAQSGQKDEPRIIVLLDGFGAFRQTYETGSGQAVFDAVVGLVADGRPVGVHFVISADRPGIVPGSIASGIQRRLVLRLAQEGDYGMFRVPNDAISPTSPPGRGFVDGFETQVAVLGGQPSTARQAAAIARLAAELRSEARWAPAPAIAQLPEMVVPADMPSAIDGLPVLGVTDETLAPMSFALDDPILVTGPPQARRPLYALGMVQSIQRAGLGDRFVLMAPRATDIASRHPWVSVAVGAEAVADAARLLLADGVDSIDGVVITNLTDLCGGSADQPLQDLVRRLIEEQKVVIGDADSNVVTTVYGGFSQLMRVGRHGVALQPDQSEGESIFRTAFPKGSRADYPEGRGLYVRHGRAVKVQCVAPNTV